MRRLVQRLHDPSRPLSRNRHFHTFQTPEGRSALKVSRRLKSLQRDILACLQEGQRACVFRRVNEAGEHRIELRFERLAGRRVSHLQAAEFELLSQLPGVRDALHEGEEPEPA